MRKTFDSSLNTNDKGLHVRDRDFVSLHTGCIYIYQAYGLLLFCVSFFFSVATALPRTQHISTCIHSCATLH